MKILLIYPLDREFMPPSMPPMGLAYIAAALENDGHQVSVVDLNVDRDNGVTKLTEILRNESFEIIGISSIITQFKKVKKLGELVKSIVCDIPLVMGGPGPTSIPKLYIQSCCADIVCVGEGEETVKELAVLLKAKESLKSCKGILYKESGGLIIQTGKRELIADIDQVAFPAWNKIDFMQVYIKNYLFRNEREKGITVLSTRGCPGHCNYCMCNFGRKLRIRSTENIFTEIKSLTSDYGVEHIHFIDDTFIASAKRVDDFYANFKNSFNGLTWSANARVDMVKPDILKQMQESGCVSLAYGIESGSLAVLKYMRKDFTPDEASNAIRWTREAGISLRTYFMIGMPPETNETIKESVEFCKNNLVGGEFFFATPFPGTELYRYAREKKIINNEELYLQYAGEVRNFVVNLTSMNDEELFGLKEDAEEQIKTHLAKYNISVKPSIRTNPREVVASLPKF